MLKSGINVVSGLPSPIPDQGLFRASPPGGDVSSSTAAGSRKPTDRSQIIALSGYYSTSFDNRAMPLPKQGDTVKVTLLNRETIEGLVEWVDGNGLWVKGAERSRWVPLEAFTAPHESHPIDAKEEQSSA